MILDITVFLIIIASALIAFLRGFIREVLTIIGVLGGFVAAIFGGPYLARVVEKWFVSEEGVQEPIFGLIPPAFLADSLSYGFIFIVVVVLLSVASHYVSGWAKEAGLSLMDRLLGLVFGVARGGVIIALLYMPLYVLTDDKTRQSWFMGSESRTYVETATRWMTVFIPRETTEEAYDKAYDTGTSLGHRARKKLQEIQMGKLEEDIKDSDMSEDEQEELMEMLERGMEEGTPEEGEPEESEKDEE